MGLYYLWPRITLTLNVASGAFPAISATPIEGDDQLYRFLLNGPKKGWLVVKMTVMQTDSCRCSRRVLLTSTASCPSSKKKAVWSGFQFEWRQNIAISRMIKGHLKLLLLLAKATKTRSYQFHYIGLDTFHSLLLLLLPLQFQPISSGRETWSFWNESTR